MLTAVLLACLFASVVMAGRMLETGNAPAALVAVICAAVNFIWLVMRGEGEK